MLEVGRLVDRKRPLASWTLAGCLFSIIAIVTSSLGHTWLTAEVSTVFLTIRHDIGLFSINRYTLIGGWGTRERATASQITLANWEHELCDVPRSDVSSDLPLDEEWVTPISSISTGNSISSRVCADVGALRSVGILSAFLTVACCVFFVLAFFDLRNALCVADAIEPHISPFQHLPETGSESTPVWVSSELLPRTVTTTTAELRHLGLNPNEANREYYEAIGEEGESGARSESNTIRSMPTVLALRSIGSIDIGLAEHLCENGRDSLKRCLFRLWVNNILLCIVLISWIIVFIKAQLSKHDLAQAIQGLESSSPPLPLSIRLSFSFYIFAGVNLFVTFLALMQPKLLLNDLVCLNFLGRE